jgi:hypothetical protein
LALAAALAAGSLGALTWAAWAGAQTNGVTINGTTLTATYSAPGGGTFLVGGLQIPPAQQGNLTGGSCSAGGSFTASGGPGGSPECDWSSPQTTGTLTITGSAPWPMMTVNFFWSPNGQASDYQFGTPFTVSPETPAPTSAPSTTPSPPTTSGSSTGSTPEVPQLPGVRFETSETVSTSKDGLWGGLIGIGVVLGGVGVYLGVRRPEDEVAGPGGQGDDPVGQTVASIDELEPAMVERLITLALVEQRRARGEESEDGVPPGTVAPPPASVGPDFVANLGRYEKWTRACQMIVDDGKLGKEFHKGLMALTKPKTWLWMLGIMATLAAVGAASAGLGYIAGLGLLVLMFGKEFFAFLDAVSAIMGADSEQELKAASDQLAVMLGNAGPNWLLMLSTMGLGALRRGATAPEEAPGETPGESGGEGRRSTAEPEPEGSAPEDVPIEGGRGRRPLKAGTYSALSVLQALINQAKSINPGAGRKNCVACAFALDLLWQGVKTAVKPISPDFMRSLRFIEEFAGKTFTTATKQQIIEHFEAAGDGARGIVVVINKACGAGHAFNVINKGGQVYFIDAQKGGEFTGWDRFDSDANYVETGK